jgi:antitoxin component of MazEF toxin-antitoxin module
MIKIIKRWGGSIIIRFSPEEAKIFNLKEGDIVEFDDEDFRKSCKRLKDNQKEEAK